jgi:hypothetical protein
MTSTFPHTRKQSKLGFAALVLASVFVLLLCGASVALFGTIGAAFWFSLIAAGLGSLFLAIFPNGRDLLFYAALCGLLGLPILHKMTGIALYGFWQVFVFAGALIGLPAFFRLVRESKVLGLAVFCFISFLLLALVCSYFGRSRLPAATYQFLSDLKPLLLLSFGLALAWGAGAQRTFWFIVRWFWLWAIAFVVFAWIAPGVYEKVFPTPGAYWRDPSGIFPGRALGPFVHPSALASVSAFFSLICFVKSCLEAEQRAKYRLLSLAYFALVFFAVQRQEIVALILAVAFATLIIRPQELGRRLIMAVLLVTICGTFIWAAFSDYTLRDATTWGLNSTGNLVNPRALLYYGSFVLAKWYFPIGSGLGTYGGAGALKFDLSAYDELGFARYHWFRDVEFLMDTYWPNSIAETGFFGAGLLLLFYCLVLWYAVRRSMHASSTARIYWLTFASSLVYMLLVTPSSPAFNETKIYFLPALMFGIAAKLDRHSIAAEVEKTRAKAMPRFGGGRKRAVPSRVLARSLRNS